MRVRLKRTVEADDMISLHNLFVDIGGAKQYPVLGLFFPESSDFSGCYICIADDRYDNYDPETSSFEPYPVWLPISDFEIRDKKLPNDWEIGFWKDEISGTLISFQEWVEDDSLYAKLVDGDRQSQRVLLKHLTGA